MCEASLASIPCSTVSPTHKARGLALTLLSQVEETPPPNVCEYVVTWRTPHACPKRQAGSAAAEEDLQEQPRAAQQAHILCPLGICPDSEADTPTWLLVVEYGSLVSLLGCLVFVVGSAAKEVQTVGKGGSRSRGTPSHAAGGFQGMEGGYATPYGNPYSNPYAYSEPQNLDAQSGLAHRSVPMFSVPLNKKE